MFFWIEDGPKPILRPQMPRTELTGVIVAPKFMMGESGDASIVEIGRVPG